MVRDLQASHPNLAIDLVIDDEIHGVNRKASNLINIATQARHGVLILSDADIVVEPDYLRNVTAALTAPGVGAVSCLYVGLDDGRLWSKLSAMVIDYQFLPSAVLGKALGMANPCFGSTIAIRTDVLERIGGFNAFADHLADDYEIGRAVRALGLTVDIPPMVVLHHSPESSARELVSHELRWARTVRQIDAAGHAGSLVTHPLPVALIAAALCGFSPLSLAILTTRVGGAPVVENPHRPRHGNASRVLVADSAAGRAIFRSVRRQFLHRHGALAGPVVPRRRRRRHPPPLGPNPARDCYHVASHPLPPGASPSMVSMAAPVLAIRPNGRSSRSGIRPGSRSRRPLSKTAA